MVIFLHYFSIFKNSIWIFKDISGWHVIIMTKRKHSQQHARVQHSAPDLCLLAELTLSLGFAHPTVTHSWVSWASACSVVESAMNVETWAKSPLALSWCECKMFDFSEPRTVKRVGFWTHSDRRVWGAKWRGSVVNGEIAMSQWIVWNAVLGMWDALVSHSLVEVAATDELRVSRGHLLRSWKRRVKEENAERKPE